MYRTLYSYCYVCNSLRYNAYNVPIGTYIYCIRYVKYTPDNSTLTERCRYIEMYSFIIYYYSCIYLCIYVLLYQLDDYKCLSFSRYTFILLYRNSDIQYIQMVCIGKFSYVEFNINILYIWYVLCNNFIYI